MSSFAWPYLKEILIIHVEGRPVKFVDKLANAYDLVLSIFDRHAQNVPRLESSTLISLQPRLYLIKILLHEH